MIKAISSFVSDAIFEMSEYERLFLPKNKSLRCLTFYAENALYLRYYEDYIRHILTNSRLDICYISSDRKDPIFSDTPSRVYPFYIKNTLSSVLSKLDARALVLSTPDLGKGLFKSASKKTEHIYTFRGVSSTHQSYKLEAFHKYDTVFCVGQYQIDEIRATENAYDLPAKTLVLVGYPLTERIHRDNLQWNKPRNSIPICLIAPTWDYKKPSSSILDNCLKELLEALTGPDYVVWLRPHPEFVKRYPRKILAIESLIKHYKNVELKLNLCSLECLHEADFLITDHSTISVDFALGTERPVLFINTPVRVDNPQMHKIAIQPVENIFRSQLGVCLEMHELRRTKEALKELRNSLPDFKESIPELRHALIANWQQAAAIGGNYIINVCSP